MVAAVAHLRTAAGSLAARRGHTALAQLPAAAGHAGGVRVTAYPAYAEGLDPDEREVPARHQRHHRQDRHGRLSKPSWAGERNPRTLARLRDPRTKADEKTIARSLQGHWRAEHVFELTQALELYRAYQDRIAECDREIEVQLLRFEDRSDGEPPEANGKKRNQKNAPRFDVQGQLYRMTGVDLTRIDGVDAYTALKVISETGTDMTKWPTAKHFASWLGLSPNNRITGGRVISSKTKPSANRAAAALRLAANALHRSGSAQGAFLQRKKAHLGAPKAITATAHKLARIIYSMLRYGQEYVAAGAEQYERQHHQRALRATTRRAALLGYELVPISGAGDTRLPKSATA